MGFRQGAYAKIWRVEDKGNYSVAQVSISKKNKDTDQYETEFQHNFVRLVGTAHDLGKNIEEVQGGTSIKITSCDVTNRYDKEKKKEFTNFANVLEKTRTRLRQADEELEKLVGTRTNQINRKLALVSALENSEEAEKILTD